MKVEKDEKGFDVVQVELRYAKLKHLEWYVRTYLEQTDMDAGLGAKAYRARLEQLVRRDRGEMPRTIPVLADLVMSDTDSEEFDYAPEDEREWPCGSEYPEDGFDEAGNEYWMIIRYRGDNPSAPGAMEPVSQKGEPTTSRFSINGIELILEKGQLACVHGRFVKHIRGLSGYEFTRPRKMIVGDGETVTGTPVTDEGIAKLDEMPRFQLDILGCAGPVSRTDDEGNEYMLLPARKKVIDRGLLFSVEKFKGALRKMQQVAQSYQRSQKRQIMEEAAKLHGEMMAKEELQRRAQEVRDRLLAQESNQH